MLPDHMIMDSSLVSPISISSAQRTFTFDFVSGQAQNIPSSTEPAPVFIQESPHGQNAQGFRELNYDYVMSKTESHCETEIIEEEKKSKAGITENCEEEIGDVEESPKVSSEMIKDGSSIHHIKEFPVRSSKIYNDMDQEKLNSSIISQPGANDIFSATNSSIISTVLYKNKAIASPRASTPLEGFSGAPTTGDKLSRTMRSNKSSASIVLEPVDPKVNFHTI